MWIHVGHLGLLWEASVLAKDLKTSSDFLMKRGTLLMFIVFSCFIQISSYIWSYFHHSDLLLVHSDQSSLEVARMESSGHSPSSELLDKARFAPGISRTSGADSDEICSQVLDLYSNQKTQRDVKKSSKEEFWKFCSRDDTWWHQYCHVTTEMVFVALLSSRYLLWVSLVAVYQCEVNQVCFSVWSIADEMTEEDGTGNGAIEKEAVLARVHFKWQKLIKHVTSRDHRNIFS